MQIQMNQLTDVHYGHRSFKEPKWKALGFIASPLPVRIDSSVILYRVWGGASRVLSENRYREGQFFSLEKFSERRTTELNLAVMQYGNQICFCTEFHLIQAQYAWVGKVFQGDEYQRFDRVPGSQVFLEKQDEHLLLRGATTEIIDNMHTTVVSGGSTYH